MQKAIWLTLFALVAVLTVTTAGRYQDGVEAPPAAVAQTK